MAELHEPAWLVIDGYEDEPAAFGVPPYVGFHIRYLCGVLERENIAYEYTTIDAWRMYIREHGEEAAQQGRLYQAATSGVHPFPSKKPVKSSETFHQQHLLCSVVGRFVDGSSKVGLRFERICSWRFKTQMQRFMLTFAPGRGHTSAALLNNGQSGHRLELQAKRSPNIQILEASRSQDRSHMKWRCTRGAYVTSEGANFALNPKREFPFGERQRTSSKKCALLMMLASTMCALEA
jgi:hypothetical protein